MREAGSRLNENIVKNMSEGVMIIGFDGTIGLVNPAGRKILGLKKKELEGIKFAKVFFGKSENDEFVQTILEAVYDRDKTHSAVVPYYINKTTKHLRVVTSFLSGNPDYSGVIVVFSDLSEVMELRDAVKSMEQIKMLYKQLEKRNRLISETFGRFLSDDIVDRMMNKPEGISPGGEKEELTILISDLRGFTAMCERMDAEDLLSMLNHYLAEMADIIMKHRGTIIDFTGDGLVVIFGAPERTKDHAADAVAAALSMQAGMEKVNKWNTNKGFPILEMGIGINTGEVILGNMGSEKSMKYGIIGSEVNLCSRIESYTVGGQVLISPKTRAQINSELEIRKEMTVFPKGTNEEVTILHVTGIGEPYDIHISVKDNKMQELEKPIPVGFHRLDGKHELEKIFYGGITAVSREGAIFETDTELAAFENIRIEAGGKLFCKILDKSGSCYTLQYTSIPVGYDNWLNESKGRFN